jgi:hypothetical protein
VTFTRVPIGSVGLFAKVIAAVKVPAPEAVSAQSAPASLGVPQQTPAAVDTRLPLGH